MKTKPNLTNAAILSIVFVLAAAPVWAKPFKPSQLALDAAMNKPILLADKKQTAYLRVGLTGFELEQTMCRTPVNIAVVIDKSGSMSGEKIARAKEAAIMAIDRLIITTGHLVSHSSEFPSGTVPADGQQAWNPQSLRTKK